MSDSFDLPEAADELHDELPTAIAPVIGVEEGLLTDEQAEDDFDYDFDDDFAEEFADEWEPITASAELVEEIDEDGAVKFVVEEGVDFE